MSALILNSSNHNGQSGKSIIDSGPTELLGALSYRHENIAMGKKRKVSLTSDHQIWVAETFKFLKIKLQLYKNIWNQWSLAKLLKIFSSSSKIFFTEFPNLTRTFLKISYNFPEIHSKSSFYFKIFRMLTFI